MRVSMDGVMRPRTLPSHLPKVTSFRWVLAGNRLNRNLIEVKPKGEFLGGQGFFNGPNIQYTRVIFPPSTGPPFTPPISISQFRKILLRATALGQKPHFSQVLLSRPPLSSYSSL